MADTDNIRQANDLEGIEQSRDEYIRELEMSLQILQREIEHLRSQKAPLPTQAANYNPDSVEMAKAYNSYLDCGDFRQITDLLHNNLAGQYHLLESNIFALSAEGILQAVSPEAVSVKINEYLGYFEEEGIIDWALEKRSPSIVPNMYEPLGGTNSFVILVPLFIYEKAFGVYIALTTQPNTDFEQQDIDNISLHANYAVVSIDNLQSKVQINDINQKLDGLNQQIARTNRFASIGQLASSISKEISAPLQVINANLDLMESGVGDSTRRIQIIRQQLKAINMINGRMSELSTFKTEYSPENIQITDLIDDVIIMSDSQLRRDGIKIIKKFDDASLSISVMKLQLEQVILSIMLFARDTMPDGGTIIINAYSEDGQIIISLTDNGIGFAPQDTQRIFEPFIKKEFLHININNSLYMPRNLLLQNGGDIELLSEIGKGTTYRLIFSAGKA